jgi:DNA-binding CsgD family transcriptional regulator
LIADALGGLSAVAAASGEPATAARWLGAAQAICDSLGTPGVPHHAQFDRSLTATRGALDERVYEDAWQAGRKLTPEEVAQEALAWEPNVASGNPSVQASITATDFGLTVREIEVLRLLAEGHSSREIGDALFISHRTASTHVANIFGKLGVDNRAAAVAKAFQHKLL